MVGATGLSPTDMAVLWDDTVLLDLQHDVVTALQVIAPNTVSINFVGAKKGSLERIPVVKVEEFALPVALRSLGEGMSRMLGIALALVNAKDGMLLIDEVDTGLHYSVLPDLWKLIFEVAHRLNVQVFATSHSWDCIEAFQQAADANKDEEGVLVRLETQDGEVAAVTFDERMLNIATREHIEVR
jgi:predicted ATPase